MGRGVRTGERTRHRHQSAAGAPVAPGQIGAGARRLRQAKSQQAHARHQQRFASINHFLAELFRLKAGITWTEVHYRGNTPAIADLLAGHVDVGFQQLVDAAQHLQGGKLTALAVPGKTRVPALPEVPTMAEAGYPEVEGVTFNGIFAPRNTPRPIVDLLSVTIRAALMKKTAIDQLAALGSQARGSTPEEFTDFLRAETRKWGELVKAANIKPSE